MDIPKHFFEHTHQPLCVLRFDGHIAAANPAFAALVARPLDQLNNAKLVTLLNSMTAEDFDLVQKRFSRGLQIEFDADIVVGNEVRHVHWTGTPAVTAELVHLVVYDRTDYRAGPVHAIIDEAIRDDVNQETSTQVVQTLIRRLAKVLDVQFALATTYIEEPSGLGDACPFWLGNAFLPEPFRYRLEGTPCGIVARNEVFVASTGVQQAFPEDLDLVNMHVDSYLGVPMVDSYGRIFGHVAIMDVKPLENISLKELAVRIFASRIAGEFERQRMLTAINESEARYRMFVENAADALFVLDRQGVVLEANPHARTDLQVSLDELVGKPVRMFWDDESSASFASDLAALKVGETMVSTVTVRRSDGTTFPAECRSVLFEQSGNEVVLVIARDMTEHERIALAREDALKSMSTPILEIWQGVLALPLVGSVDPSRASRVMASLLDAIVRTQAVVTILDLTGVSEVDASTATHLLDIMRAAALLGTQCLVSGISPSVARTMVDLDVPGNQFRTFADLSAALKEAIRLRRTT